MNNVGTSPADSYLSGCSSRKGRMKVVVKKWGNSASVRILAAVMAAARLSLDQVLDVREESGRIVIEPIRKEAFDLGDLVADWRVRRASRKGRVLEAELRQVRVMLRALIG